VLAGTLADGRVELAELHRFENVPVRLPDGLHWNALTILREILTGLEAAAARGRPVALGIDTWGVDYGLLDGEGRLLGVPFHYRDRRTEGMIAVADELIPRAELYGVTGIQRMPINTIFQLLAERGSPALEAAERIALMPDLLALWLTGRVTNEITVASTTGLLDARTGEWARDVIERLRLPARIFGELIEPGTEIGPLLPDHRRAAGLDSQLSVFAVAGHDTASAFAGAPLPGTERAAILSSGTWSLLGLELDQPVLGGAALEFNLTNERGIDGTTRLLRNVMGLWLLQECRRAWAEGPGDAPSYAELARMAEEADPDVPLFDPDLDELLAPDDMPAAIRAACERAGQRAPEGQGELVRSILTSLACKYRLVLERLEAVTGARVEVICVVGGGVRNELLCRLTAELCDLPVLAGPAEATALGNVLVQARGRGELGSLAELREVAAASARPRRYEPGSEADRRRAAETYARFLQATGLESPAKSATTSNA
jgi:rhamnulokinase